MVGVKQKEFLKMRDQIWKMLKAFLQNHGFV